MASEEVIDIGDSASEEETGLNRSVKAPREDDSNARDGHEGAANASAYTGVSGSWGADTETVFSELSADSYYESQSSPGDDCTNGSLEGQGDGRRDKTPDGLQLETLGDYGHAGSDESQDAQLPTGTESVVETSEGEGLGGSSSGRVQTPQDNRKGGLSTSLERDAIETVDEEGNVARRRDDEGLLTVTPSGPVPSSSSLGTSSSTSAGLGQKTDQSPSGIGLGDRPDESFHSLMGSLPPGFVQCPGCPNVYELVSNEEAARGGSGGVAIQELPKGASLSRRAAMRHSGYHRFRCPECSISFCGSCRVTPYHMGFNCDSWKDHETKLKCTFCGNPAEDASVEESTRGLPCCGEPDCRERALAGCTKKLPCGHACRGPGTSDCIPCMEPGCSSAEIDGDAEFCNVCWTESLLAAPCVKLMCGHFVHASCGREQLQRGRPTARLTFGFMSCPVCRADKALALDPHLGKMEGIQEQLKLANEVEEMALQRLRADELPPLRKSPMEGYLARMYQGAGFERYNRQPIMPRGFGRGDRVGNDLHYPPHYPGMGMNVRQAGRILPPFPDHWPVAMSADWQHFPGLAMDLGMAPFPAAPFMPPSHPLPPRPPQLPPQQRYMAPEASAAVSSQRALGKASLAEQIGAFGRRAAVDGRGMMIAEAVGAPGGMLSAGDDRIRRWDNLVGAANQGAVADEGSNVAHPLLPQKNDKYLGNRQAPKIAGAEPQERSVRDEDKWGLSEARVGDGVHNPGGVDREPVAALRALKRVGIKAQRRMFGANVPPANDDNISLDQEGLNNVKSRVGERRDKKHVHWSSGSSKKFNPFRQSPPEPHLFPWPIHSVLSKAPRDRKGEGYDDPQESSAAEGIKAADSMAMSSDDEVIVLERRRQKGSAAAAAASSQRPSVLGKKRKMLNDSSPSRSLFYPVRKLDVWELSRKWFPGDSPVSAPMSMEDGLSAGSDEVGEARGRHGVVRKKLPQDHREDWLESDAADGDLGAVDVGSQSLLERAVYAVLDEEEKEKLKSEDDIKPPGSGDIGDLELFGVEGDMSLAPAFRRDKNVGNRQPGAVAKAMVEASKLSAESDVERGLKKANGGEHDELRDGRVNLAAKGMCSLRFYVSPTSRGGLGEGRPSAPKACDQNGSDNDGSSASKVDGNADSKTDSDAKKERADMVQRALKKYSYYQCYSCRKPYFGGLVSCEPAASANGGGGEGASADSSGAAERAVEDVKPQELLCGKCSASVGGMDCPEHGQEFIEHKCHWCCRKVASYFCGGVMHFCDVCHLHGFAAKPKKCLGGNKCLFGGVHPPNARNGLDEFVLGCGICRPKPEESEGASSGP